MFRPFVLALTAPLLLATACATEASRDALVVDAASPIAALHAVPDLAADASTGRVEMTFTVGDADGEISFGGTGAFDTEAGRTAFTLDLGAMGDAGGSILSGFDEPLEIVVDGDVTYLRLPMLEQLTGEAGWLSARREDLGQASGALGVPGGATDPTQILDALRGAGDVVEAGSEDVRGVATTRYDATIDVARAIDQAPVGERPGLEAQLDELGAPLEGLPVSVWIDADGLARRFRLDLDASAMGMPGEGGRLTMVVELFDYGEPVAIVVPPPEDVTPLRELLGPLAGSFTDEPA